MDTQYLRTAGPNEAITLSGYGRLPGVVTNMEVRGRYEIEKQKVEGRNGTNKLGRGYNDAQVLITLEILPPDEYEQVKQIEKAFKNAFGAAGKPKPIRVVNRLLDAKDVHTILFQGFTVVQGNEDDSLLCTLEFLEFEPGPARGAQNKPQVVTGPQAVPVAETQGGGAGGAPAQPEEGAFAAGTNAALRVGNAVPNALGLPSNTSSIAPLSPEQAAIYAGLPGSEK